MRHAFQGMDKIFIYGFLWFDYGKVVKMDGDVDCLVSWVIKTLTR